MKFKGHGIVWDKGSGKRLVKFVNGVAEVDEVKGQILTDLGYEQIDVSKDYTEVQDSEDHKSETEEETEEVKPKAKVPTDWKELLKIAVELGIKTRGKNKKQLTELVKIKLEE